MNIDAQNLCSPSFHVGSLLLGGRALLAPMSGVTDVGMRRVAMRFGASAVVSEMVASDDYVRGDEESRLRAEGEGVKPHIVQIAGCQPYWMGEAARLAEASGAEAVDINMGTLSAGSRPCSAATSGPPTPSTATGLSSALMPGQRLAVCAAS